MKIRSIITAFLSLTGLLAYVPEAYAQARQRVYLAPQTVRLEPGRPAILRGACADENVKGAPGSADRITRFSDPNALVVREFKEGKPTGREQKYDDILAGSEKEPWVELRGATDLSGGADLSVQPVGAVAPGISYEIIVKRGMITARDQETITNDLLDNIKRYKAPIDYVDEEFETWAKLFGPENHFARSLKDFAQKEVYWGIARDRKPEDILTDAKAKVEQLFAGLSDDDPVRQYLLVAGVTGFTEFDKEHKDYLAKYKITLQDFPPDDRLSRNLAKVLADSRWTFGLGSTRIRESIAWYEKVFKENPEVAKQFAALYQPNSSHLFIIKKILTDLKTPQSIRPQFEDGKLLLTAGNASVDLRQVVRDVNGGESPTRDYFVLTAANALIDASDLDAAQIRDLALTLSDIGRKNPRFVFRGRFAMEKAESLRRNAELLDKGDFDIRVGGETFDAHPIGKLIAEILKSFDFKLSNGRSVELRVAHNKDILDTLLEQATEGKFKDKHLVLMICNSTTNKETFAKFLEISKTALDKGAASVLLPDDVLNPHAMTLIGLTLKQYPELMDATTPRDVLRRCASLARFKLETVVSRPPAEQLQEFRKQFGTNEELGVLFRKGKDENSIDLSLLVRVQEELEKAWIDFHELVLNYQRNGYGGRDST